MTTLRRLVTFAGVSSGVVVVATTIGANDAVGGVDPVKAARGAFRAVYAATTVATLIVDYKTVGEARYGEAHERSAVRLRKMCARNGGLYVKAGQFASTAGGVPLAYSRELSKLQDEVEASAREPTLRVVREAFGGISPDVLFESFDEAPIAAASLAQVHKARLRSSGKTVAVKIQRPGLERSIESDLFTMSSLSVLTKFFFPSFDFTFMVDEFKSRLEKEIDFELEGRNCERLARAFADDERIDSPEIIWEFTRPKVLTMEFIDGVKITDIDAMKAAGLDPKVAALAMSDAFARMLLVHGYVHGDPHPGNVLCRAHPSGNGKTQVVILDHGLYSELSESSRRAMSNLWLAIATGNASRAVGAAKELKVPDEFTWLLPLTLARKTTDGRPVNRELLEKKWAEDKAKGGVGRPGLTEASLIGQNLSKEMIIVLRANALVRNVIKALGAKDERAVTALEIRRQWSNVRYAALGVIIPNGLGESTLANVPYPTRLRWRLATIGVSTRTAFFALRRRLSTHRR